MQGSRSRGITTVPLADDPVDRGGQIPLQRPASAAGVRRSTVGASASGRRAAGARSGDPLEDQYQENIVWADLQVRGAQ